MVVRRSLSGSNGALCLPARLASSRILTSRSWHCRSAARYPLIGKSGCCASAELVTPLTQRIEEGSWLAEAALARERPSHEAVGRAGDAAFEATSDFVVALAFGDASVPVGFGLVVVAHPAGGDGVQGSVELPIAVSVEAVKGNAAGGRIERGDAAEGGERGFVAAATGVRERDEKLGGAERADAGLVEEFR